MKKVWMVAGIVALVVILGVTAVGAVALAQEAEEGSTSPFNFAARFKEALASALGITTDEYDAAVDKAQEQVVGEAVTEGWLTEDQAEMMRWRMEQAPGLGMRGMMGKGGRMFGRGMGSMGMGYMGGDSLISIAADKLGMKVTELLTELQDGKSIADVAKDKGVDTQTIVDAFAAELKADLDEAVADGDMTQKQADYALEQATERVTDQLDKTWQNGFRGGRHGGLHNCPGMGGF